ncbi:unnamed protein product [Dibothriocephalus latus]|uniref:Uncharacterized protein n=1 Tax=Dibothriocephalus latus TaxID=60516 RepID=A0A3P7MHL3_DIBLA|nr:unnamed protein product [Dibothriocephalus latus]
MLPLGRLAHFLQSPSFQSTASAQRGVSKLSATNAPLTVDESSGLMAQLQLDTRELKQEQEEVSGPVRPETGLELWLTVHSTVSGSAAAAATATGPTSINISSHVVSNGVLKDSAGPASPPIRLLPNLLLISAGSLEAAIEIFGLPLSRRLGLVCLHLRPLIQWSYFCIKCAQETSDQKTLLQI